MVSSLLLEIKDLCVEFNTDDGVVKAVDSVSLNLKRGEIYGIVGESGSGKSVTALSILRLIQQPPGKINRGLIIFYRENNQPENLLGLPEKNIRQIRGNEISMIFQEPMTSLNPVYKCGKQVSEALLQHYRVRKKTARNRVIELFDDLRLPRPEVIYDSYPHELSGGQKQRVMIAMAMICKPALLIADEPTTALDVTVQKSILELMEKLRSDYGTTILFITHDLGIMAGIADRVAVMYKGKIVEEGSSEEIFNNPKHAYTKGLLACRPSLNITYSRLPTVEDFMAGKTSSFESEKLKPATFYSGKILSVENVKTWFNMRKALFSPREQIKAVNGVSFEINKGETLGLVGESGCGKTTLGRTILRLIPATGGKIIFQDEDITRINRKSLRRARKDLQIIFQDPYSSLNPRINIGSAIQEPMKVYGLYKNDAGRKAKTYELLEKVGLAKAHYNRYPHEFSGGQRQRICIARSLSLNPKFIVCDESVSALDVSIQAQILNLLNDLKKEFGLTFIFISHDLSVVKFMADRIAVMKDGMIVEIDNADEIYKHPKTSYTEKLIESIPGK